MTLTVAVLGSTGFVGSAVTRSLAAYPHINVVPVPAPRLESGARRASDVLAAAEEQASTMDGWLSGAHVVVNAAGDPDASSTALDQLVGANAVMPVVALRSARRAGVCRFVHISSAVVQGDAPTLDESSRHHPFSPYALSKCLGEEALQAALATDHARASARLSVSAPELELVLYRPPSVHGPDRRVTRAIASLARSPLRSVAGAGDTPSPQAHIDNVGAAVAYLCTAPEPPAVVIHPWEGLTTASLLELLGGRRPRHLPQRVARLALRCARGTVGKLPGRGADVRRVELLWFGQHQETSWLTRQGWSPPVGTEGWRRLAKEVMR